MIALIADFRNALSEQGFVRDAIAEFQICSLIIGELLKGESCSRLSLK